jgi:large subunit ribosomal protein L23
MQFKPHITEKTVKVTGKKQYVFEVDPAFSKTDIRKLVEKTFGVNVIKVQTAILPGKTYRAGKRWIYKNKSDWKKAVVTIKPDQKIELFEVPGATEGAK